MLTHKDVGMQLMDNDLQRLVQEGTVTADAASMKALDKIAFQQFLEAFAEGQDTRQGSFASKRPSRMPDRGSVAPSRPSFAPPEPDPAPREG